ncbi:MAG: hypothetical protein J0H57_08465, partial [Rhodospirillales bacterium]|nr:hypothetical protein [Rhodospirillales bacterium]
GLAMRKLLPIATVPVCAPQFVSETPPDFATVPMLHARLRPEDWRRWLTHAGFGNRSVRNAGSYESLGLTLEAAAAGLGYAIGIEALLGPDLARGAVALAHPVRRPTRRFFVLLSAPRRGEDEGTRTFADWLLGQVDAP